MQHHVRRLAALCGAAAAIEAARPAAASAHGISGRASLPVPAWLFAWAAAIVLVVSFIALSTLWSQPRLQELALRRVGSVPGLAVAGCGVVGSFLFGVVIWAGYAGVNSYTANFDPTFIY